MLFKEKKMLELKKGNVTDPIQSLQLTVGYYKSDGTAVEVGEAMKVFTVYFHLGSAYLFVNKYTYCPMQLSIYCPYAKINPNWKSTVPLKSDTAQKLFMDSIIFIPYTLINHWSWLKMLEWVQMGLGKTPF